MFELFWKNLEAAKAGAIMAGTGGAISFFARNTIFRTKPADHSMTFSENYSAGLYESLPIASVSLMYISYALQRGKELNDLWPGMTVGIFLQSMAFEVISTTKIPPALAIGAATILVAGTIDLCEKIISALEQPQPQPYPTRGL